MPHVCNLIACCPCLYDDEAKISREVNRKINRELQKTKKTSMREIKLLLLGTGEAGKSTVIKQMRIIHDKEFDDENSRRAWTQSVRENVIESMYILLQNMELLGIGLTDDETVRKHARRILGAEKTNRNMSEFFVSAASDATMFTAVAALWEDASVRECYRRRAEFKFTYLGDSSKYFLDRVAVIADEDYVPTQQDILRVRKSSTGVQEYEFVVKHLPFRVVDVGGQRSERRKWIHCFENVTAMLFIASLSDYDQVLLDKTATQDEDRTVNRMEESLALFSVVIQDRFLETASIILFLNKTDIFGEKIQERDLANFFPDYADYRSEEKGPAGPVKDSKTARQFVLEKYTKISRDHVAAKPVTDRQGRRNTNSSNAQMMYSHFTCATDTENMKFVTNAVEDRLLEEALVNLALV